MTQCSTCNRPFKGGSDCFGCNIFPLTEPFIGTLDIEKCKKEIEGEKIVAKSSNNFSRPDKHSYYMGIALAVAARSTCIRSAYGAVIVLEDRIISSGFNGSRTGAENCCDRGTCLREGSETRTNYHLCPAIHAELNAILRRECNNVRGASLYLAGFDKKTGKEKHGKYPCVNCYRAIVQSGIANIFARNSMGVITGGPIKVWKTLES